MAAQVPGLTDVVVFVHPGWGRIDDAKNIKVPTSWVCPENDKYFTVETQHALQKILDASGVKNEFHSYSNTAHQFALPRNKETDAFKQALDQTIDWLDALL